MRGSGPGELEERLRDGRDAGRKLLVPYVTGGLGEWAEVVRAVADAGADACEVGIPFSDPVMDGPTIQRASELALEAGTTPPGILDSLAALDAGVPLVVMTYYNIAFRMGHERFARSLRGGGVAGAILPDLPLEEVGPWAAAADEAGVETVMLAAPTAPEERLPRICDRSRGFVYGVGLLGVTGERASLAASARTIAAPPQGGDRQARAGRGGRLEPRAGGRGLRGGRRRGRGLGAGEAVAGGWRARRGGRAHRGLPGPSRFGMTGNGGCELCEAAPITTRYHEDELCWVAECEACGVPMVVWWSHGASPPQAERDRMLDRLGSVARSLWGDDGFWLDEVMRQIPGHFHAHARRAWWPPQQPSR